MQGDVSPLITDQFRWGIIRGRIAEVINMLGDTLRPMVNDLVVALGKTQATTPVMVPVVAEPKPASRNFSWLGWILATTFMALFVGWMFGVMVSNRHSASPGIKTLPNNTSIDQQATSMAGEAVNHEGANRGWDVWNQTDQSLEILAPNGSNWRLVGTLDPGGYQSLPCKMPNLRVLFRGKDFEHLLEYSFKPGEKGWYQRVIKKP